MSLAENREIAQADKDILLEKYKTALKKTQLINEIKSGLGQEIKKNPKPKIKKKTLIDRLSNFLKIIFTKF